MSEHPETEGLHMNVEVNQEDYKEAIEIVTNALIGDGKTKTADGKVTDFKKIIASMAMNYYLGCTAAGNHVDVLTDLPVKNRFVEEQKIQDNSGLYNQSLREEARQNFPRFRSFADNISRPFWDNDHWSYVLYHYFAFLQEDIDETIKAVEEQNPEKRASIIIGIKKQKKNEHRHNFLKLISTKSGEYCMTRDGGCEKDKLMSMLVLTNPIVLQCLMSDLEEKDRRILNKYPSVSLSKMIRTNSCSKLQYFDFLAIHRTWNFVLLINLTFLFDKYDVLSEFISSRTQECESNDMINEFSQHVYLKKIWDCVRKECLGGSRSKKSVPEGKVLLHHFKFIKYVTDKVPKRKREESSSSMNEGEQQKRKREEEGSSSMNEGEQSSSS